MSEAEIEFAALEDIKHTPPQEGVHQRRPGAAVVVHAATRFAYLQAFILTIVIFFCGAMIASNGSAERAQPYVAIMSFTIGLFAGKTLLVVGRE